VTRVRLKSFSQLSGLQDAPLGLVLLTGYALDSSARADEHTAVPSCPGSMDVGAKKLRQVRMDRHAAAGR